MDNLDILTYDSLNRYFTVLKSTGYLEGNNINKLLLLIFITEMLQDYKKCMSDEDIKMLMNMISCLGSTSCLIDNTLIPLASFIPTKNCGKF